jgi:hypothetical protein
MFLYPIDWAVNPDLQRMVVALGFLESPCYRWHGARRSTAETGLQLGFCCKQ